MIEISNAEVIWGALSLGVTLLISLFGYLIKKISNLEERLREAPDRHEVQEQIDLRQEVNRALYTELKEDTKEIKEQLRALMSRLLANINN